MASSLDIMKELEFELIGLSINYPKCCFEDNYRKIESEIDSITKTDKDLHEIIKYLTELLSNNYNSLNSVNNLKSRIYKYEKELNEYQYKSDLILKNSEEMRRNEMLENLSKTCSLTHSNTEDIINKIDNIDGSTKRVNNCCIIM